MQCKMEKFVSLLSLLHAHHTNLHARQRNSRHHGHLNPSLDLSPSRLLMLFPILLASCLLLPESFALALLIHFASLCILVNVCLRKRLTCTLIYCRTCSSCVRPAFLPHSCPPSPSCCLPPPPLSLSFTFFHPGQEQGSSKIAKIQGLGETAAEIRFPRSRRGCSGGA